MVNIYGVRVEQRLVALDSYGDIIASATHEEDLDIEILKVCFRNARKTAAGAGGHGKAYDNEVAYKEYQRRLEELNAEVPDDAFEKGVFNGVGAQ
jgi:hypothetical protein